MSVTLLVSAPGAQAQSSPFSGPLVSRSSLVAARPSTAQIDRALKQRTGYPASQLTTAAICPKPASPGVPQCAAQTLVTRSGHKIIHLSAGPRQRPEQTRPASTPANTGPPVGQGSPQSFTPGYLQEAYDLSWLSAHNGVGDTVAIVDEGYDATAASDLATFRSHYSLSACNTSPCFQQVNQYGQPATPSLGAANSGWQGETSLDVDAVSSICPNCNILLVEIGSVTNPPYNSTDGTATAEQTAATLGADQISNSWTEGTSAPPPTNFTFPGVLTVGSAGDDGYTGASFNNYPAALPGVVAAGGTTLAFSSGAGRGFGESAWNDAEGATGSGCDTYETKPAYQTDVGCAGRAGDDISADADPLTGLDIVNAGQWYQYGGTSLSAPLIAAYAALIGEHTNSPAWIYNPAFASDLFDPVTGNDVGQPDNPVTCATPISYICTAGLGYDGPTGNGSISGTVIAGAPGIGPGSGVVSTSGTSASVVGGVYPNGLDTTYYWQYGQTSSYGQQTAPVDIGAGQGVVATSDTLTGLTGSYVHFRLVATNADGTVYGYDAGAEVYAAGASAPANTTAPQISGSPVTGQTLSTSTGTWSPAAASFSYRWQVSTDDSTWTNIAGATGLQYQVPAGDPGSYLRVQVTATDSVGSATASSAPSAQVTTLVPWSSAPPQITGTAVNGQTLTASTGAWAPAASEGYAYAWQRSANGTSWANIAGATAATYTLTNADTGDTVRVQVTAFDSHGAGPAASSQASATVISRPVNTSPPTVTGTPTRLDTLTASPGQWTGVSSPYTYQWQDGDGSDADWVNIPGATGQTYRPGFNDEDQLVQAVVTATNANGSTTAASAATALIQPNWPNPLVAPTISGVVGVGHSLSIANAAFGPSDAGPVSYQWQRPVPGQGDDWADIAGQTRNTYTPAPSDAGDQIRVELTSTNVDGTTLIDTPAVTVPRAPANAALPSITGTPQAGVALSASPGSWTGSPAVTLQWVSCPQNTAVASCPVVATGSSYTPSHADVGNQLAVIATATNSSGSVVADSALTAAVPTPPALSADWPPTIGPIAAPVVVTPPPPPTGGTGGSPSAAAPFAVEDPTLSGAFKTGTTITAQPATWNNSPTSVAVQIIRCAAPGSGCTPVATSSYTITAADAGHYFYALATASNAAGTTTQRQAAADDGPVPAAVIPPPGAAQTATATIKKTGSKTVKTAAGKAYATAKLTTVTTKQRKLVVTRAAGITVPVTMWACQTTGAKKCTAKKTSAKSATRTTTLTGALKISVTLS